MEINDTAPRVPSANELVDLDFEIDLADGADLQADGAMERTGSTNTCVSVLPQAARCHVC